MPGNHCSDGTAVHDHAVSGRYIGTVLYVQPQSWLKFAVIAGFGVVAGGAIAGRPDKSVSPVRITSGAASPASTELAIASTTTAVETTTSAKVTTTIAAATTTTVPTTTTTAAVTTTTAASTTTTSAPGSVDRSSVRVTVANGTNTVNLARDQRDRMRAMGYTQAQATDALGDRREETVVFVREGFESSALVVADDLALTPDRVMPMPNGRVTSNDSGEDVFVVLGNDWPT